MSDNEVAIKPKFAWSTLASTIAAGLLLAAFNYAFSSLATVLFVEQVDVYFVERPRLDSGKFQKLVVIDNFSSSTVDEVQFTIAAENGVVSSATNLEKVEQNAIGPRSLFVKIFGLLPNRQASFLLQSDAAVPEDSFRLVKGPSGVTYKAKDKLRSSWLDWSQLVNVTIQFLIYVIGILYFERRSERVLAQINRLEDQLTARKADVEKSMTLQLRLQKEHAKHHLVQIQKIMNLTRENRIWREVAIEIVRGGTKGPESAKKLLSVILKKAGIRLSKSFEEADEEGLLEAIEEAKSQLAVLS